MSASNDDSDAVEASTLGEQADAAASHDARASQERSQRESARPKTKRKWLRRLLLDLAILGLVYWGITGWRERSLVERGTSAPNFELATLAGNTLSLESLRGKRVLLHFWATWCGVCKREFGTLNDVYRSLDEDEALVSIVADSENRSAIQATIDDHHIAYPVLLASDRVLRDFKINVFPTNYLIDPEGNIAGATTGMSSRWGLSTRLDCIGAGP